MFILIEPAVDSFIPNTRRVFLLKFYKGWTRFCIFEIKPKPKITKQKSEVGASVHKFPKDVQGWYSDASALEILILEHAVLLNGYEFSLKNRELRKFRELKQT